MEMTQKDVLASRWKRLWAALIDGLLIIAITIPIMYLTGGFNSLSNGTSSLGYNLFIFILSMIIFLLLNGKLLVKNGQTIGKKMLGLKIVTLNGELPEAKNHLLKRYAVFFVPGQIPLFGQLFSFVNILFIFSKQKRCIHDIAANTVVIES